MHKGCISNTLTSLTNASVDNKRQESKELQRILLFH